MYLASNHPRSMLFEHPAQAKDKIMETSVRKCSEICTNMQHKQTYRKNSMFCPTWLITMGSNGALPGGNEAIAVERMTEKIIVDITCTS